MGHRLGRVDGLASPEPHHHFAPGLPHHPHEPLDLGVRALAAERLDGKSNPLLPLESQVRNEVLGGEWVGDQEGGRAVPRKLLLQSAGSPGALDIAAGKEGGLDHRGSLQQVEVVVSRGRETPSAPGSQPTIPGKHDPCQGKRWGRLLQQAQRDPGIDERREDQPAKEPRKLPAVRPVHVRGRPSTGVGL